MRYIIYESNEEKVLLEKEIVFISDYIQLQKLRMSAKDQLEYKIDGNFHDLKIAPLLMIPIIENAFKYGIKGGIENSFVTLKIIIRDQVLVLIVKNNMGTVDNVERTKAKGMGLANLRKRLELIYPERHHLNIEQLDDTFSVNLKIAL
jgi:LytS/YehU family sensor histidine kinase